MGGEGGDGGEGFEVQGFHGFRVEGFRFRASTALGIQDLGISGFKPLALRALWF